MHAHKCKQCGTAFYHSNEMAGNAEAHKCPNCGASEWEKFQPKLGQLPRFNVAPQTNPGISVSGQEVFMNIVQAATWILMFAAAGCILYGAVKNLKAVKL